MTAEEIRKMVAQNTLATEMIAELDEKGMEQVMLFAAGVKARAEYERQKKQADDPDRIAG